MRFPNFSVHLSSHFIQPYDIHIPYAAAPVSAGLEVFGNMPWISAIEQSVCASRLESMYVGERTAHALRAKGVHFLGVATSWALVQSSHILQCLSSQEPMPLLHVRGLLLWHRLQDSLPDVA